MTTEEIISKASLFGSLSDEQLGAALGLGQVKQFDQDEVIFKQGERARNIYVLLDGLIRLRIEAPEELDVLAETLEAPGTFFGMAALLKLPVYNVTAKCLKSTTVFAVNASLLKKIIQQDPLNGIEVMRELAQLYSNRLNNARAAVTNLLRIFKAQTNKSEVYGIYGEMQ